jgi:hypothetical protein
MVDRDAAPERLLLVVARSEEPDRYLLASWPDWPHPSLLAISPPHPEEGLDHAVDSMLRSAFGVTLEGAPQRSEERWPVRMAHPRFGGEGVGWLRPVAVHASGDPAAGPLVEGITTLTASDALEGLSTAVERAVFTAGVALLEE